MDNWVTSAVIFLTPSFKALELTARLSVQADAPELNREVWNNWSVVEWKFPQTKYTAGPISVSWHDGNGKKPSLDGLGLPDGFELPGSGSVIVGEKGSLLIPHVGEPRLFPEKNFADYKRPELEALNHYTGWAHACLGDGTTDRISITPDHSPKPSCWELCDSTSWAAIELEC